MTSHPNRLTGTALGDFTPQAEAYARARPGYPSALTDLLLRILGLEAGAEVAEIGAGTGIYTAELAARRLAVRALEPNAAMRHRAPPLAGVEWQDGTFEETGLGDASQSWVVAAQAFHWARPEVALPEIHRVLAPGGALTVLWNNRDNPASELLTWTVEEIRRRVPGFDSGYRDRDWGEVLASTGHFAALFELAVPHVIVMSPERYVDVWRSHNRLNATAGPEGMAALLAALEERLAGTHEVRVPYICRAWTARRRSYLETRTSQTA